MSYIILGRVILANLAAKWFVSLKSIKGQTHIPNNAVIYTHTMHLCLKMHFGKHWGAYPLLCT